MDISFAYNNKELIINNFKVAFDYPIRDARQLDKNIIILLSIPYNDDTIDNLFLVNIQGEVVWRSQNLKELYPKEKLLPYEQMIINEQEIRVSDFYGRRYFINLSNGKIIKRDLCYSKKGVASQYQSTSNPLRKIDEKILLLSIIGVLEVLKSDILKIEEAEKFLFSPNMLKKLKLIKCNNKITNLIERGCELEDIASLIPEKLEKNYNELMESAKMILNEYPKFIDSFWVV